MCVPWQIKAEMELQKLERYSVTQWTVLEKCIKHYYYQQEEYTFKNQNLPLKYFHYNECKIK
jgi:hypothetical protein